MSDFALYEPDARSSRSGETLEIRSAVPTDVVHLAKVMTARGGTVEGNVDHARRMIGRLDVLLIAEKDEEAVGWCGVQRFPLYQGAAPEWLIAGLTVIPEARRWGIAARLLSQVLRDASKRAPGESVYSVINARNPASIDLHVKLWFVEVGRAASYAGIEFTDGEGVLLRHA